MKRGLFATFAFVSAFLSSAVSNAKIPRAEIVGLRGYVYDAAIGDFDRTTDLFAPSSVLRNVMDTGVLVVIDIDFGDSCRLPKMTDQLAKDVLSGKKEISRPMECEAPSGTLFIRYRTGSGTWLTQQVAFKNFSVADDGHLRAPALVYRQSPCLPVDFEIGFVGNKTGKVARRLEFSCAE